MLKKIVFLGVAATLAFSASTFADVVIVVNKNNSSEINIADVKKMYLGKTDKFSNGNTAIPINVRDSEIKETFDATVIGRSSSQVTAYWSKAVFTGAGTPPKQVESQSEVLKLVSSNPNVIGYIDDSLVNDSVRTISL